jgi:hypothetical protein
MNTLTLDQQQKIKELLNKIPMLSVGIGTPESACSVGAINLALSGELTDTIPTCMSEVIGKWVIKIQDAMPSDMRNSPRWRELLPLAAGTGRERENERLAIIMNWVWDIVFPQLQGFAEKNNFGTEWKTMCTERTAADAAYAARAADAADAAYAAYAADAANAAYAARAADAAAYAADAARAAYSAAYAAANAANAACAADSDNYWTAIDPCGLLEKLVGVTK